MKYSILIGAFVACIILRAEAVTAGYAIPDGWETIPATDYDNAAQGQQPTTVTHTEMENGTLTMDTMVSSVPYNGYIYVLIYLGGAVIGEYRYPGSTPNYPASNSSWWDTWVNSGQSGGGTGGGNDGGTGGGNDGGGVVPIPSGVLLLAPSLIALGLLRRKLIS